MFLFLDLARAFYQIQRNTFVIIFLVLFFYLKIQLETLKNLIIVHDFDHNIKNNANRKDYLNCYANMSRYSAATANILLAVQVLKTYQLGKHIPFLM